MTETQLLQIAGLLVNADIVSVSGCDPVMMSFDKGNLVSLCPRCVWSRIETEYYEGLLQNK